MPYKDPEARRLWQRNWNRKRNIEWRKEAIEALGGKCVKCDYSESIYALQIDHIDPQLLNNRTRKNKHGKTNYTHGGMLARAIARGYITTDGLQLLCANCHSIKTLTIDRKLFSRYQNGDTHQKETDEKTSS